eukprot:maker-scaffold82_size396747-snap-gene-1.15 protein:Tk06818 transcript:maker-scaffold82_size396747-snap-gene-1.15-mRNA-1 annotation:"translation initiation factor eif-2b subunit delta-like isoform 1"
MPNKKRQRGPKSRASAAPKGPTVQEVLIEAPPTQKIVNVEEPPPAEGSKERIDLPHKSLQPPPKTITPLSQGDTEPSQEQTKSKMSDKPVEKTKEEILAEREAKKAAKAAKKTGVKEVAPQRGVGTASSQMGPKPEKSREGILAEREAKKAGKTVKKEPGPKSDSTVPTDKSKAELKAERRAKQEAQRAAKEETSSKPVIQHQASITKQKLQRVPDDIQADRQSVEKKLQRKLASAKIPARTKAQRKVVLFSHLHQYEKELSITREIPIVGGLIHPAVLELGLKYAEGIITGSNARCVAFMNAMAKVIKDYSTPPQKDLPRDLDSRIKPYITFLRQCRTLSVSMGNAIRFLKSKINGLDPAMPEDEAKEKLLEAIDNYVFENIVLAAKQISITACEKIRNGDVIMIFGCSSLLRTVLIDAAAMPDLDFRVIVVDGRPKFEGREMVRHLVNAAINCTYVQVSSVPYMMPEVTKVFLGAHAVLANGSVMSRVGTSQVALVAKGFNVPVLVCCETYKFSERVQTDSFVFNELGDPDDLVSTGCASNTPLADWRDFDSLTLLNLTYDVTPPSLVDAIISEVSVIPTTSVPVILRLKNIDHVVS